MPQLKSIRSRRAIARRKFARTPEGRRKNTDRGKEPILTHRNNNYSRIRIFDLHAGSAEIFSDVADQMDKSLRGTIFQRKGDANAPPVAVLPQ
jgi:hypothetical protein